MSGELAGHLTNPWPRQDLIVSNNSKFDYNILTPPLRIQFHLDEFSFAGHKTFSKVMSHINRNNQKLPYYSSKVNKNILVRPFHKSYRYFKTNGSNSRIICRLKRDISIDPNLPFWNFMQDGTQPPSLKAASLIYP